MAVKNNHFLMFRPAVSRILFPDVKSG